MLYLLMHGQFGPAFAQNPLAMVLLPVVVFCLARQLLSRAPLLSPRAAYRWNAGLLTVVLLFAVLRNIPVTPFSYLAPHSL